MALTDIQCKKATVPEGKTQKKFSDSAGLYLLVNKSGKYWRLDYRIYGKRKTLSLGVYPEVSLKEVRSLRDVARLQVNDGNDPSEMKKRKKYSDVESFEQVAREWFLVHSKKLNPSYSEKLKGRLEQYIFPNIGHFPIKVLQEKPNIILNMLEDIVDLGYIDTAHRIRNACGQVFRFGASKGLCTSDPTSLLKGAIPAKNPKSMATITNPDRIGHLLKSMRTYQGSMIVRIALNTAPYVFVRPGELRHMEWAEIDYEGKKWCIPDEKMKMGIKHIVPLSTQVLELLNEIKKFTGQGKYVFPNMRSNQRPISENTLNNALRNMGYAQEEICSHGLRAMASTILHEKGYLTDAVERQLAHIEGNAVKKSYNYAQHLSERITMMQEWADYLDSLREA
ncbi:Integrase [Mariprofundus ferrinatatus]|uniref:Integrase n=1 Tax=Mariprofundus ferrinatatus TaxID=1921087 RepID=A0A2K8L2Y2_9PROT|nr:integrase arm-type DNA-binding domain-containing protein [Mariprofundus ferrinatatus]ATX81700.1 Integrase [Mariprofundus ferrinatatus]